MHNAVPLPVGTAARTAGRVAGDRDAGVGRRTGVGEREGVRHRPARRGRRHVGGRKIASCATPTLVEHRGSPVHRFGAVVLVEAEVRVLDRSRAAGDSAVDGDGEGDGDRPGRRDVRPGQVRGGEPEGAARAVIGGVVAVAGMGQHAGQVVAEAGAGVRARRGVGDGDRVRLGRAGGGAPAVLTPAWLVNVSVPGATRTDRGGASRLVRVTQLLPAAAEVTVLVRDRPAVPEFTMTV